MDEGIKYPNSLYSCWECNNGEQQESTTGKVTFLSRNVIQAARQIVSFFSLQLEQNQVRICEVPMLMQSCSLPYRTHSTGKPAIIQTGLDDFCTSGHGYTRQCRPKLWGYSLDRTGPCKLQLLLFFCEQGSAFLTIIGLFLNRTQSHAKTPLG